MSEDIIVCRIQVQMYLYFFIVDLKRTCDKYCKPTSIREDIISRFTEHKLVRDDSFSRESLIKTYVVITIIRQWLVCGEKYSRQTLENFTLANKSWFVVLFHVFLIAVNYSRCFAWFSTRLRTKSAYLTNTKLLFLDSKCTYITTM